MSERSERTGRKRTWRIAQALISVVLVVGIFAFAIPKLAGYSAVWRAIEHMTWGQISTLVIAMVGSLFTYWWQVAASMPGLSLWQAAVSNQTSTSVADTIPGGGYVAVGVSYAMYHSWGFSNAKIALSIAVTGISRT